MVCPASFCFLGNGVDNFSNCYGKAGQTLARIERPVADRGDRVANGDAGQASAFRERPVADSHDGVGDCDTGESGAVFERIDADGRDRVGDGYGFNEVAVCFINKKCTITYHFSPLFNLIRYNIWSFQ